MILNKTGNFCFLLLLSKHGLKCKQMSIYFLKIPYNFHLSLWCTHFLTESISLRLQRYSQLFIPLDLSLGYKRPCLQNSTICYVPLCWITLPHPQLCSRTSVAAIPILLFLCPVNSINLPSSMFASPVGVLLKPQTSADTLSQHKGFLRSCRTTIKLEVDSHLWEIEWKWLTCRSIIRIHGLLGVSLALEEVCHWSRALWLHMLKLWFVLLCLLASFKSVCRPHSYVFSPTSACMQPCFPTWT